MVGGWKFVGGEGDIETGGLEDITAEELDRLQPRTSDPRDTTQQQVRLLPGETPPPSYRETSSFKLQASSPMRCMISKRSTQCGRRLRCNP